jgi:hypothetical protein
VDGVNHLPPTFAEVFDLYDDVVTAKVFTILGRLFATWSRTSTAGKTKFTRTSPVS